MSSVSVRSQPKASMRTRLPNGDFLTLTVWLGKTDPTAEVITVQIRHLSDDRWETVGRLASSDRFTVDMQRTGLTSGLPSWKRKACPGTRAS